MLDIMNEGVVFSHQLHLTFDASRKENTEQSVALSNNTMQLSHVPFEVREKLLGVSVSEHVEHVADAKLARVEAAA